MTPWLRTMFHNLQDCAYYCDTCDSVYYTWSTKDRVCNCTGRSNHAYVPKGKDWGLIEYNEARGDKDAYYWFLDQYDAIFTTKALSPRHTWNTFEHDYDPPFNFVLPKLDSPNSELLQLYLFKMCNKFIFFVIVDSEDEEIRTDSEGDGGSEEEESGSEEDVSSEEEDDEEEEMVEEEEEYPPLQTAQQAKTAKGRPSTKEKKVEKVVKKVIKW